MGKWKNNPRSCKTSLPDRRYFSILAWSISNSSTVFKRLLILFLEQTWFFLRDGPYSGLYVLFYRRLQEDFNVNNSTIKNFACATTAGATATILTQPADVLRCHLQIDMKPGFSNLKLKHIFNWLKSWFHVSESEFKIGLQNFRQHIFDRGYLKALFLDGLGPRITRRTFVSAVNWTIFEEMKKHFANKQK